MFLLCIQSTAYYPMNDFCPKKAKMINLGYINQEKITKNYRAILSSHGPDILKTESVMKEYAYFFKSCSVLVLFLFVYINEIFVRVLCSFSNNLRVFSSLINC